MKQVKTRGKVNRIKGFTLIELLIVVAIIGILAAIAVPNFMNAMVRAKIADVQSVLRTMELTVEQYRLDNNALPPHFNDPRQNAWMTTPIAYVNSRPYDIFQDFNGKAGQTRSYWSDYGPNERRGCPHYEILAWASDNTTVERVTGAEGLGKQDWWIYTVGPDQTWSSEFSDGLTVVYDISNGLLSNGDIIKFRADSNPSMIRRLHQ